MLASFICNYMDTSIIDQKILLYVYHFPPPDQPVQRRIALVMPSSFIEGNAFSSLAETSSDHTRGSDFELAMKSRG